MAGRRKNRGCCVYCGHTKHAHRHGQRVGTYPNYRVKISFKRCRKCNQMMVRTGLKVQCPGFKSGTRKRHP